MNLNISVFIAKPTYNLNSKLSQEVVRLFNLLQIYLYSSKSQQRSSDKLYIIRSRENKPPEPTGEEPTGEEKQNKETEGEKNHCGWKDVEWRRGDNCKEKDVQKEPMVFSFRRETGSVRSSCCIEPTDHDILLLSLEHLIKSDLIDSRLLCKQKLVMEFLRVRC